MAMPKIKIGRYETTGGTAAAPPVGAEWAGWIEPEDKSWILFIRKDGRPSFFSSRDKDGGVAMGSWNLPAEAVAGTMLGAAHSALGAVEWAWVNEKGALDGEAREISRAIASKLHGIDINEIVMHAKEAVDKDGR